MKTVFMGTPDFAVPCLNKLFNEGHEIGFVITQPDKAKDRGKKLKYTPVKEFALEHDLKVYQPIKIKDDSDILKALREYSPDIIVVVAYGQILPKEILDLPRLGAINVHASLLPELRGASPIQHAIMQGKEETGVTIMQMSEGLDTGDMLTKAKIEIKEMNCQELTNALSILGAELLAETLVKLEKNEIIPQKQDDSKSTYAGLISKKDGKIDFTGTPEEAVNLIRAFNPRPGAFFTYKDMIMKVFEAQVVDESLAGENGKIIAVNDKGILVIVGGRGLLITEIQVPGKKKISVKDYIKGNTIAEGEFLK